MAVMMMVVVVASPWLPSGPEMLDDMVDGESTDRASISPPLEDTSTFQAAGNMTCLPMHEGGSTGRTETY